MFELMSARLVLGIGVGGLLMGVLNIRRDLLLASGLALAGIACVLIAAAMHHRVGQSLEVT